MGRTGETGWYGGTPMLCQEALAEELRELFAGMRYNAPAGPKAITVYLQELPMPEEIDADADTETAPTPFIIVRSESGKVADDDSPQALEMSLILCGYDDSRERSGWRDVVNMRERIIQHVCSAPYFGGAYTVERPIKWMMQQDDTHPYYYGVITLYVTTPALSQDTELAGLV